MSDQQELITEDEAETTTNAEGEAYHEVPAVRETRAPVQYDNPLFSMASDPGVDIDKLKELIAMKEREEDRQCKREFDRHFSEMQRDYVPVGRTAERKDDAGNVVSKYAKLGSILKVYNPILAKHGFSHRFSQQEAEDGGLVITCHLSGHGHTESASFKMPVNPATKFANSLQQVGTSNSYGQRYAFCAVTGLYLEDDDDGQSMTFEDGVKYADYINALEAETNLDSLKETGKRYHDELKTKDPQGDKVILAVYKRRKEELEHAAG